MEWRLIHNQVSLPDEVPYIVNLNPGFEGCNTEPCHGQWTVDEGVKISFLLPDGQRLLERGQGGCFLPLIQGKEGLSQ